ncbi:MAG: FecR domain-containing protein [Chloroflexi bacterium]|nr:FecR domain-containing protein [Chloroflexota bacterium]
MERATWLVLALALLLFGVLATALSARAADLVAYVEAPGTIEEISGVLLVRPGETAAQGSVAAGADVFPGDRLQVSFGSTARVRLFDGSYVDLFPETRLRIDRARAPRFGGRRAETQLGMEAGATRVVVASGEPGIRLFELMIPTGVARLEPGEYTVRIGDDATRISVWDGKATMLIDRQVVDIPPGKKIILTGDGRFELADALENVLVNGRFTDRLYPLDGSGWQFFEDQTSADVRGQISVEVPREINAPGPAVRFTRQSVSQTHNETGLRQRLERDVAGARAVVLAGWLKIDDASLSGGGYLGSEYPVMIRIRYSTIRGGEQVWTQGFYYQNPENRPVGYGDRKRQGEWEYFEKDLTALMPSLTFLHDIQVLAAGHSYDASVANLRLLVD